MELWIYASSLAQFLAFKYVEEQRMIRRACAYVKDVTAIKHRVWIYASSLAQFLTFKYVIWQTVKTVNHDKIQYAQTGKGNK